MESLISLMPLFAASSLAGVLGATLLERLVPILPSYVLLLGIGIAVRRADGLLVATIVASLFGSISGCAIYYYAASHIGVSRARRWGNRLARLSFVSQRRLRRLQVALRRNAPLLSLVSQLIPSLRIVAPGMAGAVAIPPLIYFRFAAIGIVIWNLFFISAGYFAAQRNPQADAGSITLVVIGIFLGIELSAGALWWASHRHRRARRPACFPSAAISGSQAKAAIE